VAFALAAALVAAPGCGGGDDGGTTTSLLPSAGGGGTLAYAIPGLPATLDPLAAKDRAALTVTRQVHEPLIERVTGPYGASATQSGLALTAQPSPDRTVWTLTLRPGVRFQDGIPFNSAAVLANGRRWSSDLRGRKLLPHLFAIDAPRPDEVRFLLDSPVPDLPRRLSSPQLGIVSPQALQPQSGQGASYRAENMGSGTGPFEAGTAAPERVELSRFAGWWGTPLGLGPALDGVSFVLAPSPAQRLQLLQSGAVQVADALDAPALHSVNSDPLLATVGGPVSGIGLEGSVRGIDSARSVPLLSGVWLTHLTG
jgi:peptide/nickel transport system substrate-binding protein